MQNGDIVLVILIGLLLAFITLEPIISYAVEVISRLIHKYRKDKYND